MGNETLQLYINEIETSLRRKNAGVIEYAGVVYTVGDRNQRIDLIRRLTEDYAAANDKYPDGALLERLADAVLNEELSDPHPDKVTREEYPFFSEHQLEVRAAREPVTESMPTHGVDGRDHRLPKRRKRTDYELWYVDAHAKGRNADRRKQYAKDKAPGKVSDRPSEPFTEAKKQGGRWRSLVSEGVTV
jgi:hypothetical protein